MKSYFAIRTLSNNITITLVILQGPAAILCGTGHALLGLSREFRGPEKCNISRALLYSK